MMKTTFNSNYLESLEKSWCAAFYDRPMPSFKCLEDFTSWVKSLPEFEKLILPRFFDSKLPTDEQMRSFFCAFSHSSFVNENSVLELESYERLELLGDSVLDLLVVEDLMKLYPHQSEGEISRIRGSVVNSRSLAFLARLEGLPRFILLGKGEWKTGGLKKEGLQADVFESWLGFLYLAFGMDRVRKIWNDIKTLFENEEGRPLLDINNLETFDAKTRLQEFTMKEGGAVPDYTIVRQENDELEVEVRLGQSLLATGTGKNKREASQAAARAALENMTGHGPQGE